MISNRNDGFDYCFGKDLTFSIERCRSFNISNIMSFNNYLSQLSTLTCGNFLSLSYLFVDVLFNRRLNYYNYPDSISSNTLSALKIESCDDDIQKESIDHVNTFCDNLKNYLDKCTKTNSMRNIKKLQLMIPSYRWDNDEELAIKCELIQKLLNGCGCIADAIYLVDNTKTTILVDNVKQLKAIFHDNLTCFGSGVNASLTIAIKNKSNTTTITTCNTVISKDEKQTKKNRKIGMLKTIGIEVNHYQSNVCDVFDTLKSFDTFSMRRNVQCYTIEWKPSHDASCDAYVDSSMVVLNTIFFDDYDKHLLLKKIQITLNDDNRLVSLAKLLYYFNQHYKQLFVERKFYLKHFEKITVNFTNVCKSANVLIQPFIITIRVTRNYGDMSIMFDQTSKKKYAIDQKVI